jgi:hypothetical protein
MPIMDADQSATWSVNSALFQFAVGQGVTGGTS